MGKKRRRNRVFVLGAGASASCGLPVAQYLLGKALAHLQGINGKMSDGITDLLEYLYPNFNVAQRNYPNIEDFMNLIEMAMEFNSEAYIRSSLWPTGRLQRVNGHIIQMITDYIWNMMQTCRAEPVDKFVAECLRPGDTIVTFNWDLTVEKALERSKNDLDFWYTPSTDVLLLKPHGSIDWFRKADLPKTLSNPVRKIDDELYVYPEFTLARNEQLKGITPVIVPPVSHKDFKRHRFFKETWRRVYRKIAAATDVFFIGYSLPKEDQFARLVLSRALLNNRRRIEKAKAKPLNVTVVNPDEGAQVTFMKLLGQGGSVNLRYFQTTFDQFVDSIESEDTDLDMD